MDDLNITMEEYISLEEEKDQKCGKVSVESEFPAIAFNDEVSSKTLSREPTISSLNNKIDFRVSFDDSDDEDYTPTVSYLDDLDFFKEFENEFPAIVYNDAQTSKSDLLTEPILSPQHIDEFDLNDEISLSKYDEEKQNVLYFNDRFPFNIICPDDLKSEKDNDNNEIDIIQSSKDMAPLPPRDQRHIWLRYHVEGYTEEIVHDFEQRLKTIFGRQVNRVHILDFEGLTLDMRQDLAERMRMLYTRDDGQEEFILEFFSTCRIGDEMGLDVAGTLCFQMRGSERLILDKGDLSDYWVKISSARDFLRGAPSYTYIRDPVRRLMDRVVANVPYMLAQYLFRHAEGRKSDARLSGGYFIRRLAHHFGLVSDDGLRGLSVVAHELSLIDMGELVKLNICMDLGDDWAWVAPGPERQHVAVDGAPEAAEDAPVIVEGDQAIPAPVQAPQQPPPPPPLLLRLCPID
ncbi:hypothetical protein Tco_1275924 [Tanacetum coccineum]